MKKILLFSLLSIVCFLVSKTKTYAQQEYDTICESYTTYYSMEEALKNPLDVQRLDLSMQKLTVLPDGLMQFQNLVCLDLSFNKIGTLPATFASLNKLRVLNLVGTRFMPKVPIVLSQMPNLQVVDLRDHPEWPAAKFDEAIKLLPHVTIIK